MAEADAVYDVIVVGSGAGGLATAVICAVLGLDVTILEKQDTLGGTTALSDGMVWVPNNPHLRAMGREDNSDTAELYLDALGVSASPLRRAVLDNGPRAIAFLHQRTQVKFRPARVHPDHYPGRPGASFGGRVLEPLPFSAEALGPWFERLKPPLPAALLFGGMMVDRTDLLHFRRMGRSLQSFARVTALTARYAVQRAFHNRGTMLHAGNALVGRLLASALDLGAGVEVKATVTSLVREEGRVVGVTLEGGRVLRARRGVVLATGGFARSATHVESLLPEKMREHTAVDVGASGDGLRLGADAGGVVGRPVRGNAVYVPVSLPRGRQPHPHTSADRSKPGAIVVTRDGRRFTNEARPSHQFVQDMLVAEAIPCHLICDADFMRAYGLGAIGPLSLATSTEERRGYLVRAESIQELAVKLGLDPVVLDQTVNGYNTGADQGRDGAFGRGADAYQRHAGDPTHLPNPCVAPLRKPPFYAVTLHPGTFATAAGFLVDTASRVLDAQGAPVPGLYAAGTDVNSVMDGTYPASGAILGPVITLAYMAAQSLAAAPVPAAPPAPAPPPVPAQA